VSTATAGARERVVSRFSHVSVKHKGSFSFQLERRAEERGDSGAAAGASVAIIGEGIVTFRVTVNKLGITAESARNSQDP
jgi:hypothetical protein